MFSSFSYASNEFLITTIVLVLVYIFSVTFTGAFQALTASYFGDDTAQSQGFLSLNPFDYISLTGIIFLIMTRLGWSKIIPINPYNIDLPHRKLKLFLTYMAPGFMHFLLGITSLFFLIYFYSLYGLAVSVYNLPPHYTGLEIVALLILNSLIYFNFFMSFLVGVIGFLRAFFIVDEEEGRRYSQYQDPVMMIVPIILIILIIYVFQKPILYFITWLAYLFSYLLGAL